MPILLGLLAVAAAAYLWEKNKKPSDGSGSLQPGITPQLVTQCKIWLQTLSQVSNSPSVAAQPAATSGPVPFYQAIPIYTPTPGAGLVDPTEPAFVKSLAAFQKWVDGGQTVDANGNPSNMWQYLQLGFPLRLDGVLDMPTAQALQKAQSL